MKKRIIYAMGLSLLLNSCSTDESPLERKESLELTYNEMRAKLEGGRNLSRSTDSKENWMSSLDDDTRLLDITIPGTHDSAAINVTPLANNQSRSIRGQLEAGIRYFDLRFDALEGKLYAYHGPIYLGTTFMEVLKEMSAFLKRNPTEVIVVSSKKENSGDKSTWVNLYNGKVNAFSNEGVLLKNWSPLSKIGAVRGKILPVSRETFVGTSFYRGWKGSPDLSLHLSFYKGGNSGEIVSGYVSDYYHINTILPGDINWKFGRIADNIYRTQFGSNKDKLAITFTSGASAFAYPVSVASAINPRVATYIKEKMQFPYGTSRPLQYGMMKRSGWIVMDFANDAIIEACVGQSVLNNNRELKNILGIQSGYLPR
ncbi:phosphatidylinositol-specific phospholipase C domain-containing protein [Tenacibaculum maritimum]|uniref:phosphatidylinositol-specific phospholipase C domain-containing protein n=2 Tax=Tenacibaculum maritimum TaxID=107401 RepID=UPI0010A47CCD|nr:phosphatidylinositol-specific phospholipase C domain-containing protein [Tenacibaculum maritimum]MCD9582750.1 hypothetical protein [Tenacibaculum maritimum]MCD9636877.1 hypothetical protein [Tenacibaculum maritimum]QCD62608.1 hypothetical protein B9C57_08685 [Tenacibaculum maritimum]CAA0144122.1 1-phosphatidylinositol phosphodiesterase precursor [Tenacibaculum maritimum]CAA0191899.1 1-phosphatidylinositol phosphodiesterase precursor [Tenacibaculum maritimum]